MPGLVSWRILRAVIWPPDAADGAGSSWHLLVSFE